ncbi:hypothetical protein TNCV_1021261 [Trichonephila clavipes]|uniref:Uncharacterized protein n=1 Tax=Trichonephila clavipes TaxID=2585209 RepID=A0A8X6STX9_TRICX|nr:hypothetical protein TNCV_1021261 [Trichonephila clavipes]
MAPKLKILWIEVRRSGKPHMTKLVADHTFFCEVICEYSPNRPNESGLRMSRGYSKAILDQLPNEQETAVRTDVESRNHVKATPAQIEACMDSNGGCFA